MAKKHVVGITMGDPAGIGPEVLAKSLLRRQIPAGSQLLLIGDGVVFRHYRIKEQQGVNLLNVGSLPAADIEPGAGTRTSAQAALSYLETAVKLLKEGRISALVTGPVNKENITALGQPFSGHTEYLAKAFAVRQVEMLFVSPKLRVLIQTRHIPLMAVGAAITRARIFQTLTLANAALIKHFKISRPRIAVCGLNPHAGEGGTIGREEQRMIIPAIRLAQKVGIAVQGPFAADTLFTPENSRAYDLVLAMYHDQGLVAIKSLCFHDLVNVTIGLPFIRTSPAHGTAMGIAGKNLAECGSMAAAIRLAALLQA